MPFKIRLAKCMTQSQHHKKNREDVSKGEKNCNQFSNFNILYLHILHSYIKHVPKCTFSERPNIKNQRTHTSIDFSLYTTQKLKKINIISKAIY